MKPTMVQIKEQQKDGKSRGRKCEIPHREKVATFSKNHFYRGEKEGERGEMVKRRKSQ